MGGQGPEERLKLDPGSPWWGEHRSRYRFAQDLVEGKKVLDCACGNGFGTAILAAAGATVVGCDYSFDAVKAMRSAAPGADAVQADATLLPFRDGSFDIVTSFETIEHIDDDLSFLRAIDRVLAPRGQLVLSTPNARHTQPVEGKPRNPFHVREYLPRELHELLEGFFEDIDMLGQVGSDRYRFNPYWQHPEDLPTGWRDRVRHLVWRVFNRMPPKVRDKASRIFASKPFYPGEHDFDFRADRVEQGHVTVVVCRKRSG